MTNKTHIVLVIGASASGKSTYARQLAEQDRTYTIRSLMTRDRRDSDNDNECTFCTVNNFKAIIEEGNMLEHEQFNGNYYGTSFSELTMAALHDKAVKVIDPRGAKSIIDYVLEQDEEFRSVFQLHLVLVEADHNSLISRLVLRGGKQSTNRIAGLKTEIETCQGLFDYFEGNMHVNRIYVDGEKPFPNTQFPLQQVPE